MYVVSKQGPHRRHRGVLPIARRGPSKPFKVSGPWMILVGLFVVCLSVRAFFWKPAAHDDALQRLRAAKQAQHGYGDSVSATLQQFCEEHFGMEWLRRWGSAAQQVCSATQKLHAASIGTDGSWSRVTCRSMNDSHMPAASAPHVLCDATNLRLDPSKLHRARCPRNRPGYLCTSPTYHRYERGAWSVACAWPGFSLQAFSRDHQQDIFESFEFLTPSSPDVGAARSGGSAAQATVEELPTLLVTREVKEHANVFHTLTDLLNVYISLEIMGWQGLPRQVVMLDSHEPGPLDMLWPVVAAGGGTAVLPAVRGAMRQAGGHPWDARLQDAAAVSATALGRGPGRLLVRRASDYKGPATFRHAVFVPPGYASLLFAHLYEDSSCPLRTTLFAGFRTFVLSSFGLEGADLRHSEDDDGTRGAAAVDARDSRHGADAPLRIRLITRRPGKGKARMARQIGNEAELMAALQEVSSNAGSGVRATVRLVDFVPLSVEEQLALVQQTDILVGMHGAALAYTLLLPSHAALVELWPQADGIWRCYQNFAQWAGALYRRVGNTDPERHRDTPSGDVTTVAAGKVAATVRELLPLVQQRRAERLSAEV